jgi:tetratricopeptide (TPR) repeat protein
VLRKKKESIILQRISQKPTQLIHHKAIISLLYEQGRFDEAKHFCHESLQRWPDMWWPNVMRAHIISKLGHPKEAEHQLLQWIQQHDDFNHWFFAGHFYYSIGQKEKCFDCLRQAARSKIGVTWVNWEDTDENFGSLSYNVTAWHAALLAYRENRIDLCLLICNHWDSFRKKENDLPYLYVFVAACRLREGKYTEAKTIIGEMMDAWHPPSNVRVETLMTAIERKELRFQFEPRRSDNLGHGDVWNLKINYH